MFDNVQEEPASLYLVLSGPWAGKLKTVRQYDRRPYTPAVVEELRKKKETVRDDIIYDKKTPMPERAKRIVGTFGAFGMPS